MASSLACTCVFEQVVGTSSDPNGSCGLCRIIPPKGLSSFRSVYCSAQLGADRERGPRRPAHHVTYSKEMEDAACLRPQQAPKLGVPLKGI